MEAAEKQADEILANARRDAKTGGVSPFIQALEEAEAIEAAALAIAERMKADAAAAARKIVEQARSAAANVEVMVDVVDLSATQSGHRASSESLQ